MLNEDRFKLAVMLKGIDALSGAGIVIADSSNTELMRRPAGTGSEMFVILHKLDRSNDDWSEAAWRHAIMAHLLKVGTAMADMAPTGIVFSGYACIISMGGSSLASARSELFEAARNLQDSSFAYNMQYLQLQAAMQDRDRAFTAISNIMKARHENAKNSISNIR
jgi:hypothetical protein